jgi:hypothetical protein
VTQSCSFMTIAGCEMTDFQPYWTGRFIPFNGRDLEEESNATTNLHQLCQVCEPIRQWLKQNPFERIMKRKGTKSFPHYATGRLFERSVQNGCHLCALLWHSAVSYAEDEIPRYVENFRTSNGFKAEIYAISPQDATISISSKPNENMMHGSLTLGAAPGMQLFYLPLHSLQECPKVLNCFSR